MAITLKSVQHDAEGEMSGQGKNRLIESALKLVSKGKFEEAISLYEKALELDSKDTRIYTGLGDLFAKTGKKNQAIKAYLEAAKSYTRDGYYSKAIAVCKQILEIDKQYENRDEIYVRLGDLYHTLGMVEDAKNSYNQAIEEGKKRGKDISEIQKQIDALYPPDDALQYRQAIYSFVQALAGNNGMCKNAELSIISIKPWKASAICLQTKTECSPKNCPLFKELGLGKENTK